MYYRDSILFNIFLNDLFFLLYIASLHNIDNDSALSSFAKSINGLAKIFESDNNCAINWPDENKMIVNPDKFQAIMWDNPKSDVIGRNMIISNQNIQAVSDVKMLEVHTDLILIFNWHIGKIFKSASNQLNALAILKSYAGQN